MTFTGPARPPNPLDIAKQHVERALGPKIAKRLAPFRDGGLHVKAGGWALFLAWLVDFVVFVLGVGVGVVVVGGVGRAADLDNGPLTLGVIVVLFLVPLLYGVCYRNGRALGAVLTGSRLVRFADGGRIGGKAPWAMLVRTILLPLFVILLIGSALTGGGSTPGGASPRVSIDDGATRQLHAAGFLRLDVPSRVSR